MPKVEGQEYHPHVVAGAKNTGYTHLVTDADRKVHGFYYSEADAHASAAKYAESKGPLNVCKIGATVTHDPSPVKVNSL